MKAIVVREFGSPDVMKLENVPEPVPGPGQVTIRVHAVGVNPVDTYIRAGAYARKPNLPYTPGTDVGGIVHAVGANVTRVKAGDRVYGHRRHRRTCARSRCARTGRCTRCRSGRSFQQGAAIGVPYATAWRALLMRAQARPGETVLVHGASGGVGTAAVQIARAFGHARHRHGRQRGGHWRSFAARARITCSTIAKPTTCSTSRARPADAAWTSSSRCSPT